MGRDDWGHARGKDNHRWNSSLRKYRSCMNSDSQQYHPWSRRRRLLNGGMGPALVARASHRWPVVRLVARELRIRASRRVVEAQVCHGQSPCQYRHQSTHEFNVAYPTPTWRPYWKAALAARISRRAAMPHARTVRGRREQSPS